MQEFICTNTCLNEAVFAAYGWKDEKILEKLLALNLERSQSK